MSEPMTGGRLVSLCLSQENVRHVFCVPGESYLEVLDGLYDFPQIQLISTRHESGAAFMAEAYAKASGQVGVCMATRAVGLSNLSIGLHTAKQDSTPLIALVGHVPQAHQEREAFQEVPLAEWFRPVCKWTVEIREVHRIPELIHRAFYVARTGRPGPVLIVLPQDVLEALATTETPHVLPYHSSIVQPDVAAVEAVHEALIAAKRPLMIVGGGVIRSGATDSVLKVAERYVMPVVTSFRRFDAVPNSAAYYAGWLGFGPHRTLTEELRHADIVLAVGTRLSQVTTQDYTLPSPETEVIVVDVDPLSGVTAHAPKMTITSDADAFCKQLLASGTATLSHAVRELRQTRVQQLHRAYLQFSDARQVDTPRYVSPERYVNLETMMHDFVRTVPADTIVTSDAGNFFGWLARYHRFETPGTYVGPTSGAMGYALPAAIGVKLARPTQTVVAFAGDGGFMMTMSEMATAMMYGVKVIAIVVNNKMYGTIRAHQERKHKGRQVGTTLWNPSFSELARSFGGFGVTVRTNAAFLPALEGALQTEKFAVIEILSNPSILSVGQETSENRP